MIYQNLVGKIAKIVRIDMAREKQLGTRVTIMAVFQSPCSSASTVEELRAVIRWPSGALENVDIDWLAIVSKKITQKI